MKSEFNLIDEPWILVRTADCDIHEVSMKDVFLYAHNYVELAGETKTQDIAILRLLLAMMYTVFSRYDTDGQESELRFSDKWKKIWNMGYIPSKPFEKYFETWKDRFFLFDEKYPFHQTPVVKGKTDPVSTAKLIGSLFESGNKPRLFSERINDGRELEYSEAARWLIHLNGFDDIAAKKPTPKKAWNSKLGLIAIKGKNLFETIMLNFVANVKDQNEIPVWERELPDEPYNRLIAVPDNQAELLTLRSRSLYLYRENDKITGYYISGGDYFEQEDVYSEQMTLWREEKDKKAAAPKFKPARHDTAKKAWQEFGAVAAVPVLVNNNSSEQTPGVIMWLSYLSDRRRNILDKSYRARIMTASVIYDYGQATSLPVIDYISDGLTFHLQLLLEAGEVWRRKIIDEIKKCEDAAKKVWTLSVELQKAAGASGDKISGEEAKMQFYDRIDRPFRIWLSELDPENLDIEEYPKKLEDEVYDIAGSFGGELAAQNGSGAIFGRRGNSDENKKLMSTASALNIYIAALKKIFNNEGGEKNG